jgi:hypothetical protein
LLPLALLLATFVPAAAMDRGSYSMEILVDGRPLQEYAARQRHYVEALEGREYSIRLTNHTSRRVAVALSVDGLNTIDARATGAREGRKWILGPYDTITLDGWQTSQQTARRFYFTTEDESYGAWLGQTRNLGVISAAFFREKRRPPVPIGRPYSDGSRRGAGEKSRMSPAAPQRQESRADAEGGAEPKSMQPAPSDDLAATGIGREVDHRVRRVQFDAERNPAAVAEIRYEYHDALVRLGVLPRPFARRHDPLRRREHARGFDDIEFAPDPFR